MTALVVLYARQITKRLLMVTEHKDRFVESAAYRAEGGTSSTLSRPFGSVTVALGGESVVASVEGAKTDVLVWSHG